MRLGVMQPYFFPYLGYFSLIRQTDRFIFFDTPQYRKRSWMSRNRILNANGEPAYLSVPLRHAPQRTAIRDMRIDDTRPWRESMLARLVYYKARAPYYKQVEAMLEECLFRDYGTLAELNIATTKAVCRYLGMEGAFDTFSEMGLVIAPVHAPDEWALNIAGALGCRTYVNPPGGIAFFDRGKYERGGVELLFLQSNLPPYEQGLGRFEAGLSIIDVMMFNSVERIGDMLGDNTLL